MNVVSRLRVWVQRVRGRDQLDREMQEEMQLHIDLCEADLRARGVPPGEASRRARAAFGSVEARKDEARTVLGLRWLDEARADAGYALRLLRRSPGFTAVAVLSLGLGIGANTAIFSVIDTVLLKELPVHDPGTLFFVDNSGGKSDGRSGPPYPGFELLRDRNTTMSGLAAFRERPLKVTIDGAAEEMPGQFASGTFFEVLGLQAHRGRLLTPADDLVSGQGSAAGGAAVISHRLWQRRFRGDPATVGRSIQVGVRDVTIVGVMPPEFFGLQVGLAADVIVPMALSENNLRARSLWWFSVVGRLKPGVPVEQARAELHTLWDGYMNDIGQPREKRTYFSGIELVPASRGLATLRRQLSEPLLITMTIVGLVLLIGCANVANLLLARVSARHNELAVRLAVGASRGRIMRQLLTEGVVLSLVGAAAGLIFARWGVSFLLAILASADGGRVLETSFDWRVFAFTIAAALVSAVLFSLAPALQVRGIDAPRPPSVGVTDRRIGSARLGQGLVLVQVVLSIALLSSAAMFLRSLLNLHAVDTGFNATGVVSMAVHTALPRSTPAAARPTPAEIAAYHAALGAAWRRMIDSVTALPGVTAASVAVMSPFTGNDRGVHIAVSGSQPLSDDDRNIHVNHVTEGFFNTLGIPVVAGRAFTDRDRAGAPRVTILNRTAARTYFAEQNPVGRRVSFPGQPVEDEYEVVGVVGDVRYVSARDHDERMAYVPIEQMFDPLRGALVVARGSGGHPPPLAPLLDTVMSHIPGAFVPRVDMVDQLVEASLTRERLLSILATFFGALALLLACLGLYGVMAYGVERRTREIGIRLAIGASKWSVTRLILRDTMVVVVIGAVLGAVAAALAGRFIQAMLFEVAPGDPVAVATAISLLVIVAAGAGYLPARRATRVDPVTALRYE
jgi:predicted permease